MIHFSEFRNSSHLANIYLNTQLHEADQWSYSALLLALMKHFFVSKQAITYERDAFRSHSDIQNGTLGGRM